MKMQAKDAVGGRFRVIPRLDIKGPNLVKGVHLEGLRVLGKPERFAAAYYAEGADELLYMDIVASLYERNSLLDIVSLTAKEIFIPLTVGGGLRSLDDIQQALRAGADKVALNTAAVRSPDLIRQAANKFGSSTIVISIEAIRTPSGTYEAYTDNGREKTGLDAIEWAMRAAELGAGELLITSIDREGTGRGYDIDLTRAISTSVAIPVIACGGGGAVDHVVDVATRGQAQAVAVASMLHYDFVRRGWSGDDFDPAINVAHLRRSSGNARITDAPIPVLKEALRTAGVPCRDFVQGVPTT